MKKLFTIIAFTLSALLCSAQINGTGIDEEAMLTAINELRADGCMCGTQEMKPVSNLRWDKDLADIAKDYATHLQNNNENGDDVFMFMSHVGQDGSTLETRLADAGYEYKDARENIAYMKGNSDMVIDYWLNNPESCNTLMDKKMTVIGAARAGSFWVLIIAQPIVKKKSKK